MGVSSPGTAADRAARDAPAGGRLGRLACWPSWACVGALLAVTVAGVRVPPALGYVPLVASAVLVGLPHGAVDYLVPTRATGADLPRSAAAVGAVYAVLGGAYAALWFVAPAASFVGFLLLTWVHWGQGDCYSLARLTGGGHLRTVPQRVLAGAVRGGLPMVAPLVAFPDQYRAVAAAVVGTFDPTAVERLSPLFAPAVRATTGVALAAAVVGSLALGLLRAGDARRDWLVDAGETVLLAAYFLAVPPVLAVGVYFVVWHSLRHVARVVALDDVAVGALAAGRPGRAAGRFVRDAAPTSLLALVGLAWLVVALPRPAGVAGVAAVYLVVLAVLTLPHVAVVTWLDREQGVWSSDGW